MTMIIRKGKIMRGTLFVGLLAVLSISFAQNELSISQSVETALANNFDIQIAEIQERQATRNNNWGEAGALPTITFSLTDRNVVRTNNSPTSFLQGSYYANSLGATIDAGWMLFNGFQIRMNKERLAALQYQSEGNAELVVRNTVQSTILGYYQCLYEKERLEVFKTLMGLSGEKYKRAMDLQEIGVSSSIDALQEKSNFLSDSTNYVLQKLNYRNAVRNFNVILARDVETPITFTDSLVFSPKDFDLDALQSSLDTTNASLYIEMLNVKLSETDLGISKSQLYPSIQLNLGSNYGLDMAVFDGAIRSGSSYDYYLNFSINWTLFNGGQIKRGIKNAEDNIRISQLQLSDLKLDIVNRLRSQYELYEVRKSVYNIANQNLKTSELNLKLSTDRFDSGLINSFDYRLVQNNYMNAKLEVLNTIYQLIEAETEILRLTGGILD